MQMIIGLGANLGRREETLERAIEQIAKRVGKIVARSSLIETEPLLHPETPTRSQPKYLNGAIVVETGISPQAVLVELLSIEQELGRTPAEGKWEPRTIDLDLIAAADIVISSSQLTLPHPEMHRRGFVLYPLYEIAPEIEIPGQGHIRQLLRELDPDPVQKLDQK